MKKVVLICLLYITGVEVTAQGVFKDASKSIYALYGRHLRTNYITDSGQNNLVGRKNFFTAELGLNLDYSINKKWMIRTGINGHLLFLDEVGYGISGPVPTGITSPHIHLYKKGVEYIESVSVGIPIKAGYNFYTSSNFKLSLSGGAFVAVYFPASDEMAGVQSVQNSQLVRLYWVTRHFKNYKSNNSFGISYPQLEWDFDLQGTRAFKKYGALSLGLKAHIGTNRLESATFVIWPNEPGYRSTGHFKLNRSYIGVFSGFTFGRQKS